MEITKFNHACIKVQSQHRTLVIDPGNFSPSHQALQGAEAILITHEHADHCDLDAVLAAMAANPELTVFAPSALAPTIVAAARAAGVSEAAARIHAVVPGMNFTTAGMEISTHGGLHAVIHHSMPAVSNVGYFINKNLFHPGDSYQVPEGISISTLLIPAHAPWAKIGETIEFLSIVGAPVNIPIHDGLLNDRGLALVDRLLGAAASARSLNYHRILNGEAQSVDD
jgi:L-ascorbate metabolism protein UlaG (beta-lactamase superfamily)